MKKIIAYTLPFLALAVPILAFADTCASGSTTLCNPLGYTSLITFLQKILSLVAQIGLPVIVLFIVFIGFRFIAAEGKPEKLKEVQSLFFWALVGALLVLGAWTLAQAIQGTVTQLQAGT